MTEYELFNSLRPLYPALEYALLPQVASGTGSDRHRHADALALSLWPSRGLHLTGFEIKSHRGDWLREKSDPAKAEAIAQFCHFWYVVAANDSVCRKEELPEAWGLLVHDEESGSLKTVKKAPPRADTRTLDLPMIAAILRRSQDVVTPQGALTAEFERGRQSGRDDSARTYESASQEIVKLKTLIHSIEKKAGIRLDSWRAPDNFADAFNAALNGEAVKFINELRHIATDIHTRFGVEKETLDAALRERAAEMTRYRRKIR